MSDSRPGTPRAGRAKFIVGILLVGAAVVFLIVTSLTSSAQYFYTVQELQAKRQEVAGKNLRVSGAVIGESIAFDAQALEMTFTVADVPATQAEVESEGGLAAALAAAVRDPNRARLSVHYVGPKPDLLRAEAQAIMTGQVQADGTFHADELLLKCPTRYEEASATAEPNGEG
jgi:cytochrome c-type biogenesis protein CcmE